MGEVTLSQSSDYTIKILIVGNSSVGKSSLLNRYIDDIFSIDVEPTSSIHPKWKILKRDNMTVKIELWDTPGAKRFRKLSSGFFRGALGFVLVYDITKEDSFKAVEDWVKLVKENVWDSAVGVLVGNKADLLDITGNKVERVVQFAVGALLAEQHGLKFLESSAHDRDRVAEIFEKLVTSIIEKLKAETAAEEALRAKELLQTRGVVDATGAAMDVVDSPDGAKTDASLSKCTLL